MTIAPVRAPGPAARHEQSAVTVYLPSNVDLHTAHALRCQLLDTVTDRPTRLVVDMSKVCSVDATVAAVLVGMRRRLGRSGGKLELANVSAPEATMLRRLGLARFLGC